MNWMRIGIYEEVGNAKVLWVDRVMNMIKMMQYMIVHRYAIKR